MDIKTIKGAMLGLVVGDALGVPVEFMSSEDLAACPVTGMRGYGTHDQPAGTWSDDSSMALCLMESLSRGLDYEDMASTYLRWADEGYWTAHGNVFDIGFATRKALVKFAHGVPALACGCDGQRDNGNGSLMRIMPLALYLHEAMGPCWNDEKDAHEIVLNTSRITHAHPISCIACGIYCSIANEILRGHNLQLAIDYGIEKAKAVYATQKELSGFLPEFQSVSLNTLKELPIHSIRGSGYVLDTLVSSLWCLLHTDCFRSCVLQAVNLGEDTDTVGAVTGGLAGLYYGLDAIPKEWLSTLSRKEDIETLCDRFHEGLH